MAGYTPDQISRFSSVLENASAEGIVNWALRQFGDRVVLASSFGAEDVVLVDLLAKTGMPFRVFLLDTGRLHQETYDLVDRIRSRYDIKVEVYFPDARVVERLTTAKGLASFRFSVENRKECCHVRKVEPLRRALSTADAWITGLRRSQSITRSGVEVVELDESHGGILKISPLAAWSEDDLWSYIKENKIPYHPLHDQGYPSIGCAPCTRAVAPGEDIRAGRWWWEQSEHKECGLHNR